MFSNHHSNSHTLPNTKFWSKHGASLQVYVVLSARWYSMMQYSTGPSPWFGSPGSQYWYPALIAVPSNQANPLELSLAPIQYKFTKT